MLINARVINRIQLLDMQRTFPSLLSTTALVETILASLGVLSLSKRYIKATAEGAQR